MENMEINEFYKGKKVLVTGHTGFKGAWLSIWLKEMGAEVIGFSIDTIYPNSLYEITNLKDKIVDLRGDIKDLNTLKKVFEKYKPDMVFHLAAQSIVRLSYDIPQETFATNILGTVNVLECIRLYPVKSSVIITSDKCYKNIEQDKGYIESDPFSDDDPYSTSKGCAEIVTQSYRNSFNIKVATTRAGNVVGGGDWAPDRLIPDTIKSLQNEKQIIIRNPNAVRPWQHVLEPLRGYLIIGMKQYEGQNLNSGWNFGPKKEVMVPVLDLVQNIVRIWGSGEFTIKPDKSKHEFGLLYLNHSKAKKIGWEPKLDLNQTINLIVHWYKNYSAQDPYELCVNQIKEYEQL